MNLWCSGVFDSDGIQSVTATIIAPDWPARLPDNQRLVFDKAAGRYQSTYNNFVRSGEYRILYTAEDTEGNISPEKWGRVIQASAADAYEVDDASTQASLCVVDWLPQDHNFHDTGDTDWVWFYAIQGATYTITATPPNLGACDPTLEIFSATTTTNLLVPLKNWGGPGIAETIIWGATYSGRCYVRVRHADPNISGATVTYQFRVIREFGLSNAHAVGISDTAIRLTWDPSIDPDITGYRIERSLLPSWGYSLVANIIHPTTQYVDSYLIPDTTYFYWFHEYDSLGQVRDLTEPVFGNTLKTPPFTPTPTPTRTPSPTPDMSSGLRFLWHGYE